MSPFLLYYEQTNVFQFLQRPGQANSLAIFDQPSITKQKLRTWADAYSKVRFDFQTYLVYNNKAYVQIDWSATSVQSKPIIGLRKWTTSYGPLPQGAIKFDGKGLDLAQISPMKNGVFLTGYFDTDMQGPETNYFKITDFP